MSSSSRGCAYRIALGSIPALLLLLILELASLHYYFHDVRPEALGVQAAANDLRLNLLEQFGPESVNKQGLPPNVVIFESLYSDDGKELLAEFRARSKS